MVTSRTRALPKGLRAAHQEVLPSHFISTKNILVAFGFRCNLACQFCMVEDSLDVEKGVPLDTFREFAANHDATHEATRIIFSGGEATLETDLLDYVEVARSVPGVKHVRLQTNATKLASPKFAERLWNAGVDEFFVSLHGATAHTCDEITRVPGSFRAILAGLRLIADSKATLYTNTCIVQQNFHELEALVDLAAEFSPAGMDFWGLWPRLDLEDKRQLHARVGDVQPHLLGALAKCVEHGINPVVKWFPHCLLGEYGRFQNDAQPTVLIQGEYWAAAPEFACIYESVCVNGRDNPCAGLSEAYVSRYGWEERLLKPQLRASGGTSPAQALVSSAATVPRGTADPGTSTSDVSAWLESLGVRVGDDCAPYAVERIELSSDSVRITMRNGASSYVAYIYAKQPGRPAFAETPSFSVVHSRVQDDEQADVARSLQVLVARLREKDTGVQRLPT